MHSGTERVAYAHLPSDQGHVHRTGEAPPHKANLGLAAWHPLAVTGRFGREAWKAWHSQAQCFQSTVLRQKGQKARASPTRETCILAGLTMEPVITARPWPQVLFHRRYACLRCTARAHTQQRPPTRLLPGLEALSTPRRPQQTLAPADPFPREVRPVSGAAGLSL